MKKRLSRSATQYLDGHLSVQNLLEQLHGIRIDVGQTFLCPFHRDTRKSAKLYSDNSFFCFGCAKQYPPHRILLESGVPFDGIMALVPTEFHDDKHIVERKYDERLKKCVEVASDVFKEHNDIERLVNDWCNVWSELKK